MDLVDQIQFRVFFSDPCFNHGDILTRLGRDDAEFVMVIHSNSGVYGQRDAIGAFIFYFYFY